MRDTFFYDIFIEPFTDGFLGALIGVLVWGLSLVLIFIIGWFGLYLIDSVDLKEKHGEGIVVKKWFEPEHTFVTVVVINKVSVPQIHHVPDRWLAEIEINGITDDVFFTESNWDSLFINQKVSCIYTNGRIWNSIYIKSVSW